MEISIARAERLLDKVAALKRASDEKARESGRNFNIFSILDAERSETSTHSAFIVELLNRNGTHGQGGKFLELFINTLKNEYIPNLDVDSARVVKELHIGRVNSVDGDGGRIDIFVSDASRNAICIENKIYAMDQHQQLVRYSNYLRDNRYEKSVLLYLTLYGSAASDASTRHEHIILENGKHYHCISYQTHILDWLVECHKAAIYVPVVREAIDQYINLIKKLTKQSMETKERDKLVDLVRNHPEEFFTLNEARRAFFGDIDKKLNTLKKELNLTEYEKPSVKRAIWDHERQQIDLKLTLVICLKPIDGAMNLELKIRLGVYGWEVELWNIEKVQVEKRGLRIFDAWESNERGAKFVRLTKSLFNPVTSLEQTEDIFYLDYEEKSIHEIRKAIEDIVQRIYRSSLTSTST